MPANRAFLPPAFVRGEDRLARPTRGWSDVDVIA
jgi:hypothetical protein